MCICVRGCADGMDVTYVCSISSHVIEPKRQKKNVTTKCLRVHVHVHVYYLTPFVRFIRFKFCVYAECSGFAEKNISTRRVSIFVFFCFFPSSKLFDDEGGKKTFFSRF